VDFTESASARRIPYRETRMSDSPSRPAASRSAFLRAPRLPSPAALLALAALPALAACTAQPSPWFRHVEARQDTTIFSALDLPTPTDMRGASGAPGPAYWQQQADYVIDATLEPTTRVLTGSEHVTYHNNSPDTLTYLWMNLEQNAFRADSLGVAVAPYTAVGVTRSEGDGCTITALRSGGGADLPHVVYDTQMRIDLAEPIAPGASFEFDVEWFFTVPENVFRRFGIERVEQGRIFELAHWFPQVSVYDDVHGWNTLPYIGTGEFYSNFGDYDVRLTVPREHLLVATGVLQNPAEVFTAEQVARLERAKTSAETVLIRGADEVGKPESRPAGSGPLTWHFKAQSVRTFAFATSEAFILDAAGQDGVLIQSAYPKEGLPTWGKSTQMLKTAIAGYSKRWFPYPYPVATNVNGPEGGMEYPMIIFCGGRGSERGLYGVTTHEIGHNWFPMMVNTDERRHAWMDEGFNTFINRYSMADWFGEEPDAPAPRTDPAAFAESMLAPDLLPVDTPADALPRRLLGQLQYTKTGVGLTLLREQIVGPERFDAAFREYIRRWAFKSPQPADFYRTMEDAAGMDLAWFWRGWFQETGYLDQCVREVAQSQPVASQAANAAHAAAQVTVQASGRPVRPGGRVPRGLPARISIDNLGELVMPAAVRITFDDGTTLERLIPVQAFANTNRFVLAVPTDRWITRVVIDEDGNFPDVDRGNNTWINLRPRRGGPFPEEAPGGGKP